MKASANFFIKVKDFTVTNEEFDLVFNEKFQCLETQPQPALKKLGSYYESEEYISHTDASKSFVDKLYQIVKKHTLRKKLELVHSVSKEKSLLDVGCGTGDFLKVCQKGGFSVTGVEPNKKAQNLARMKLGEGSKLLSDLFKISEEKFDIITMWHVLEHVPDLETYVERLTSLLQPGGILIVAVPNYKSFDATHYKEFWAAYDVPRHLWHFSKKSIETIFSKDFNLKRIKPMWFDSFYVSILSEKYKSGKANLFRAFFVGLWSNVLGFFTKEFSSHIYILKRTENSI